MPTPSTRLTRTAAASARLSLSAVAVGALGLGALGSSPGAPVELPPHLQTPGVALALAALAVPPIPASLPAGIENLAALDEQTACVQKTQPGVLRFSRLVLQTYPGSRSMGIIRDCSVGGTSEHKEGRAWDWGLSAGDPHDVAEADALIGWLLAPDAAGHEAAMARRLGVMYVIWNDRIWKTYQASAGWQPYHGASAHEDHMHFSFSWAGALAKTSFWSGSVSGPVANPYPPVTRPAPLPGPGTPPAPPSVTPVTVTRPAPAAPGQVLRLGASGPGVVTLQRALGLTADGAFGPQTRAAVVAYQSNHGLTPDGVVGPATWAAITAGRTATPVSTPPPAPVPAPAPARPTPPVTSVALVQQVLHQGASGPAVAALQSALGLPVDGAFGPQTRAAVVAFQGSHGLAPDGVVGPATWAAITGGRAATPAPVPAPRPVAVPVAAPPRASLPAYGGQVLSTGVSGPAVAALQSALGVPADGAFGPQTRAAVVAFQGSHGLTPDGVAGPATWAAVADGSAPVRAAVVDPIPAAAPTQAAAPTTTAAVPTP